MAEVEILVKKDTLTEIIERKEKKSISEMIDAKELAMLEAIEKRHILQRGRA